jgi:hypothetical protein
MIPQVIEDYFCEQYGCSSFEDYFKEEVKTKELKAKAFTFNGMVIIPNQGDWDCHESTVSELRINIKTVFKCSVMGGPTAEVVVKKDPDKPAYVAFLYHEGSPLAEWFTF